MVLLFLRSSLGSLLNLPRKLIVSVGIQAANKSLFKNCAPLTSFPQQLQRNNWKLRVLFKGEVCLELTWCIHSNSTERRKPAITHFFLWIIFCYEGESVSLNHKYSQTPPLMQIKLGSCRKNAELLSLSQNPITSFLLTTLPDLKAKTAALLLHLHACLQAKKGIHRITTSYRAPR